MEEVSQIAPAQSISSDSMSQGEQDYTLLWIAVGIIALYWYSKTTEKKQESFVNALVENESKVIDSYSKFIRTPLGSRYESALLRAGIKPSVDKILRIDRFLQKLSKYEQSVFKKAAQFERRKDAERALTEKELGIYLPIRKKLMEIMDSILQK